MCVASVGVLLGRAVAVADGMGEGVRVSVEAGVRVVMLPLAL